MEWRRKRYANSAKVLKKTQYPESVATRSGYKFLLPGVRLPPILEDLRYTEETVCQAIKHKQKEALAFLIMHHSNLFGKNSLLRAAETGDWEIFSNIKELVGSIEKMRNDLLYSAICGGSNDIIEYILDVIGEDILTHSNTIVKAIELGKKRNFYITFSNIAL